MSDFKVGDRVAEVFEKYNPEEDDTYYGVVEAISSNGQLLVKWDSSWHKTGYVSSDDLMPEAEAITKFSVLEAEFNLVQDQVIEKMNEAAQAITEASEIAKAQGLELPNLYDAYRPLYRAMDAAGWQTSSFSC
jgi:hypothetical protein